jgi:hypothetical protein
MLVIGCLIAVIMSIAVVGGNHGLSISAIVFLGIDFFIQIGLLIKGRSALREKLVLAVLLLYFIECVLAGLACREWSGKPALQISFITFILNRVLEVLSR